MDDFGQQILSCTRRAFYQDVGFAVSHYWENLEDLLHYTIFADHIGEGVLIAYGTVELLD